MTDLRWAVLAAAGWAVVVAVVCGVSFLVIVGRAFATQRSPRRNPADIVLAPGTRLGRGNAVLTLRIAWAV